jgi:hypothetical protein
MNQSLIQDARLIQYSVDLHHKFAACPICSSIGPAKEQVLKHLQQFHAMPLESWELLEAHGLPPRGTDRFWIAVKRFHPTNRQESPSKERKAVQEMRKAQALPEAMLRRIERAVGSEAPSVRRPPPKGMNPDELREVERKNGNLLRRLVEKPKPKPLKKKRKSKKGKVSSTHHGK